MLSKITDDSLTFCNIVNDCPHFEIFIAIDGVLQYYTEFPATVSDLDLDFPQLYVNAVTREEALALIDKYAADVGIVGWPKFGRVRRLLDETTSFTISFEGEPFDASCADDRF